MVMTGSIPGGFHDVTVAPLATLVCDAQHENIDFCGEIPGRPALARRGVFGGEELADASADQSTFSRCSLSRITIGAYAAGCVV